MTQLLLIGVVLVALAAVSVAAVLFIPRWLTPDPQELRTPAPGDQLTRYQFLCLKADHLKARNDVRNGLLQTTAGLAVIAALLATWLQVEAGQSQFSDQQDLTRRGQLADRFRAAVEQMATTDSLDARLGGIYVLESVARDAWESNPKQNRMRLAVYDVLVAFLDHNAAWTAGQQEPTHKGFDQLRIFKPDWQAALTVLARRDQLPGDPRLDMAYIAIPDASLLGANLRNCDFVGDDLQDVDFIGAHLEGAAFGAADLRDASLYGAHLENADLREADLSGARDLGSAHLDGATADSNTRWPGGFDWTAAGVKMVPAPNPL